MAKLAKFVKEELIDELCRLAEKEAAKKDNGAIESEIRKLEQVIWASVKSDAEAFSVPIDKVEFDKFKRRFNSAPSAYKVLVREPGSYRSRTLPDEVTGTFRTLSQTHDIRLRAGKKESEALEKIFRMTDDLESERTKRRSEIQVVVNSLNTHKQMDEVMPEFYEVLCHLGHGPSEAGAEYLPAVQRGHLAKMCGLPPKRDQE